MTNNAADPFILPPHSVVSFSGGRTSGYLLWRILQANGGKLPPGVVVVFCNTGLEHELTYQFVKECGERWGVPIRWLEYRYDLAEPGAPGEVVETAESRPVFEPDDDDELQEVGRKDVAVRRLVGSRRPRGRHYAVEVGFGTASRKGEPFRQVIMARGFLPNPVMRFCTAELKIRTTNRFVRWVLNWEAYQNAIGLRADEPKRVAKMMAKRTVTVEATLFGEEKRVDRGASHPSGESPVCPLADAGVTNQDVLDFWASQPFDLKLPADERTGKTLAGNCDLCFLKGAANITALIRENPEAADWWIETETLIPANHAGTARFRHDRPPYAELKRIALGMVDEPGWLWADRGGMACGEAIDCNCTD